jgi:hypothetical protein
MSAAAAPCAWEGGKAGASGSARRCGVASSWERDGSCSEIFCAWVYVPQRGETGASFCCEEEGSPRRRVGRVPVVSGAGGPAALTGFGGVSLGVPRFPPRLRAGEVESWLGKDQFALAGLGMGLVRYLSFGFSVIFVT